MGTSGCPQLVLLLLCCWTAGGETTGTVHSQTAVSTLNLSLDVKEHIFTADPTKRNSKVAPPLNPRIKSINFNTMLYWDYQPTSPAPHFTVELRDYIDGETSLVETCTNISEHFCDISNNTNNPVDFYWGRVKAVVGFEESDYEESPTFSLPTDGKIGPPDLDVSINEGKVVIDVFHPLTPFEEKPTVSYFYEDFTYKLNVGSKEIQFDDQECGLDSCRMTIPPPEKGEHLLCISAKGFSELWKELDVEQSEEICRNITYETDKRYWIPTIIVFTFVVIALTALAMFFVYKTLQDRNITLPKALAFILHHGADPIREEPTPELVSPVSVVGDERRSLLEKPPNESNEESELQTTVVSQISIENESLPVERDETEEHADEYAAPGCTSNNTEKRNYFQADTSSIEVDSLPSDSGPGLSDPGASIEEKPPTNVLSQSFGYDKPHVPMSLAAPEGEGEGESVMGYS